MHLQHQAEVKATELVKKQQQGEEDLAQQLEQAQRKFEVELSAAAAHHAERMLVKEAEVRALKEVSSLSQMYKGLLRHAVPSILGNVPSANHALYPLLRGLFALIVCCDIDRNSIGSLLESMHLLAIKVALRHRLELVISLLIHLDPQIKESCTQGWSCIQTHVLLCCAGIGSLTIKHCLDS